MNSVEEVFIIIIYIVLLALTQILHILYKKEKKKHQDAIDMWQLEKNAKVKRIEYLEQQLEEAKSWQRVIKIEQIHLEPRELECTFAVMPHFVDDTETFKKIVISETARYLAEELERDPYLCKIYHSLNTFECSERIKVRFRMLPYPEGVIWNDIFKKEEDK